MSKFDSQATESLYKQTPDDELGQSLDGWSWFGLYRAHDAGGGSIVIEDTYGFVTRVDFETDFALYLAWHELATDPETNPLADFDFLRISPLGGVV